VAATLEQRRKQRFEFLRCLYKMSHGSERVLFYIEEVGDAAALGELEALAAAQSLAERRLIRVVMGHIISISQAGADELEAALEQPDQPTMHLPPPQTVASRPVAAPLTPIEDGTEIREEWVREEPIEPVPGGHILEDESNELAATELKRICEAIGLDPKELAGDLAPHHRHASPEPLHERNAEQIDEPATNGYSEHDARNPSAAVNNDSPQPCADNGPPFSFPQAGANELEAALEQPEQPTMHLPPAQTLVPRSVAVPLTPIEDGTANPSIREEWVREEPIREESIEPVPGGHILEDESDEFAAAELKRICEAIGLDPKALSGDLASHHRHASPESFHERDPDQIEEPATNGHSEHDARNVSAAANNDSPKPRTDNGPPFSFREADLDVILESQRQQLPKLGLAYDELAEAQSEIDTARAQLASPKPKRPILAASLRTLLSILENAAPPLTSDTWENVVAIRDFQERLSA
jgi:hypothetical protein